jgi:PAS domain S-box-containing protein
MLNALEWLIDRTSSGVLLIGEDGHIVHASGQIEQTFGYPRRGVVGMHFDELVAEPFRRTLWARCGALLSDTTPRPHATIQRLPMVRRDGSSFAATIDVDLSKVMTFGCWPPRSSTTRSSPARWSSSRPPSKRRRPV